MKEQHLVRHAGKTYAKSLHFGNRQQKVIFRNKRKYSRQNFKGVIPE